MTDISNKEDAIALLEKTKHSKLKILHICVLDEDKTYGDLVNHIDLSLFTNIADILIYNLNLKDER
jgi:hypothetical protein